MEPTSSAARELARLIMSQSREEWQAALECCTEDCLLDTDDLRIRGKTRIAKVLAFTCSICSDSGLVGEPIWDEHNGTITYTYFRHLKLGPKIVQRTILHLRLITKDKGPEGSWEVFRIGDPKLNMAITRLPILGPIQLWVMRPIMSWFIYLIGSIIYRPPEAGKTKETKQNNDPMTDTTEVEH
ncbi:hypothetical protein M231_06040 [Tremella mesenterica]|uniref:Uncharacterized protein n=1 Tax=Tremella mesenterica TaxID=5217 RepID=A0A4Q1BGH9_TREME|nr:uncharacterized protein TREMEDRAFT_59287 [Tremella mesenterica DSM 1558]EIW73124.1 hypothetical protein TREMEDRAFT_59287 [Tremella mesenterica DSM 1558]RXK36653.1 hypothetical protein M231_06040 [Tremella mesenterica]